MTDDQDDDTINLPSMAVAHAVTVGTQRANEETLAAAERLISELCDRLDWIASQVPFRLLPAEGVPLSEDPEVLRELEQLVKKVHEKTAIIESPEVLTVLGRVRGYTPERIASIIALAHPESTADGPEQTPTAEVQR